MPSTHHQRFLSFAVLAAAFVLSIGQAQAGFVSISSPDAGYLSSTTLIDPGAAGNDVGSISDGILTVLFSATRTTAAVGVGWGTWSSPPDSETPNPPGPIVLAPQFADLDPSNATLTFSQAVTMFGLEVEPDDFGLHTVTVDFYDGLTKVGSISREVLGNAGALLFAAAGDGGTQFTSVHIYSDSGIAFANVRYQSTAVPEPASLVMFLGAGVTGLALTAVRRRRGLRG